MCGYGSRAKFAMQTWNTYQPDHHLTVKWQNLLACKCRGSHRLFKAPQGITALSILVTGRHAERPSALQLELKSHKSIALTSLHWASPSIPASKQASAGRFRRYVRARCMVAARRWLLIAVRYGPFYVTKSRKLLRDTASESFTSSQKSLQSELQAPAPLAGKCPRRRLHKRFHLLHRAPARYACRTCTWLALHLQDNDDRIYMGILHERSAMAIQHYCLIGACWRKNRLKQSSWCTICVSLHGAMKSG